MGGGADTRGATLEHADRNKDLPCGPVPPTVRDEHAAAAQQIEVRTT